MCELLKSGKNLITTTYTPLIYPQSLGSKVVSLLEQACAEGKSSFHCTGIEPGYNGDALVMSVSSLSQCIDGIRIQERMNVASYDEPLQLRQYYGFGCTPGEDADQYQPGLMAHLWSGVFHMLADGLGFELDEIREYRDTDLAKAPIQLPRMRIEPGQIAAVYFRLDAMVDGEAKISLSHVYTVSDDCGDHWDPQVSPERARCRNTRLVFEGSPPMILDLALGNDTLDPTTMGIIATASRVVNAIPVVCEEQPGVRHYLAMRPVVASNVFGV